ncbi:MAG: hypothetical protein JXJ20_13940 [Anaerolineae bacterium]|nr:hypothetical protein [Anaerolineae bacterium]
MTTAGQQFYGTSTLTAPFTRADVLDGHVIRLSPALITITDGRIGSVPPDVLRDDVTGQVRALLDHSVRSFHVDINFDDYGGFGSQPPDRNAAIFTPDYVADLNTLTRQRGGFLTLHLLTDDPAYHLRAFEHIPLGAVCFQLDAVPDGGRLADLVEQIRAMGACASPVIETTGTGRLVPVPPADVRALLDPVLPSIGMLTFQAAGTAARSNLPAGAFARDQVAAYIAALKPGFEGTIQLQGGITTATICAAVGLGAEFLVAGTQIFHHPGGLAPPDVIDAMLHAAARGLKE